MHQHNKTALINNGLWIDGVSARPWADACRLEILAWLGALGGNDSAQITGEFRVEVVPPTFDDAKRAFESNTDLLGVVRCQWGAEEVKLEIPMPFHGVFLSHRPDSQRGLASVWASWLGEAVGFRLLRPTRTGNPEETQWRIGLPGGKFVGGTLEKLTASQERRLEASHYFGSIDSYPEWLRPSLAVIGLRDSLGAASSKWKAWGKIVRLINGGQLSLPDASDEDDLDHRILLTYPVWLKYQIAREFLKMVLANTNIGKRASRVLSGLETGCSDLGKEAWDVMRRGRKTVVGRLVWAIHAHKSADKTDWIDPINPLDLASRITRVRRIHRPASKLEEMPAAFRQNHPSFQGRLCPVDSPESEQVGLSLQLAAGATVDFDGRIHKTSEPAEELSYGAALIPFFAHNDGARNMMGAKNLRQAVPLRKRSRPAVETGQEAVLESFVRPLVEIGVCPDANVDGGGFGLGRDLLVAYIPWYGMNFEDAIVLGQQVVDDGLLDFAFYKRVRRPMKLGWVPADPAEQTGRKWSENGLAKVGTELMAGSPLASFVLEGQKDSKRIEIRYEERIRAILKGIRFHQRSKWTGGVLEYELELPVPVRPGDKLMGRHGNKGVVGTILPSDKMPRLPDSEELPKQFRDRPIDVLLNPHGVISRMNLGQLIETHVGWVLHSDKCRTSDLLKSGIPENMPLAAPFSEALDHGKVQTWLEKTGLDSYGRIRLVLPDGTKTVSPVVVGFQHIVRLRHVAEMKSQARRGGAEALYSVKTGQAIHGRKLGGGQRLGEMEVWALAGHQAEHLLEELFGIKCTAELAAPWEPPISRSLTTLAFQQELRNIAPDWAPDSQKVLGYSRLLQDWLSALLIDLTIEPAQVGFSFKNLKAPSTLGGQVTSPRGLESCVTASFRCRQGGKKSCDFQLLNGQKIAFPSTPGGEQAKAPTLLLRDLLDHLLLLPDGALRLDEKRWELALTDMETGRPAGALEFEFTPDNDQLKGEARPVEKKIPVRWPASLEKLHLYGRFIKSAADRQGSENTNWDAKELLAEFQKEGCKRSVVEMRITCPEHRTSPLAGTKPFGETLRGMPGGLFDPCIFGCGLPTATEPDSNRWGYIDLPAGIEIPYPLHVFLTPSRYAGNTDKVVKAFLATHEIDPSAMPLIRRIPVLPSRYRMPARTNGGLIADVIERQGYVPIVQSCLRYERAKDDEKKAKVARLITRQIETLFRLLVEALQHKSGLIRLHGLGRRVDRSARLVVTPNPELQWDQAGIPTTVLLELVGDRVVRWLDSRSKDEKKKEPLPSLARLLWLHPKEDARTLAEAHRSVQKYLENHPNFVVLLNRQPSLHRDNFQAFHPVPLPPTAGDVIQLCPLACKGFAADFDGDEMVVHVPLGAEAQKEAARLLPSRNLFSLATKPPGNVLAHFDQDFVLGTYWLGTDDGAGAEAGMRAILPGDCCRQLMPGTGKMSKGDGVKLLSHLATIHPETAAQCISKWMRMAFATCSKVGVSFGYYELREIARSIAADVGASCDAADKSNAKLEKVAVELLQKVLTEPLDFERPGLHFAAMALSGARGKKEQIRQIIAARGLLEPGVTGFKVKEDMARFFFRRSLVDGLDPEEAFFAAMNARSSMCDKKLGTGYAGALTRSLVFALWPYRILSADCGSTKPARNPASCREQRGFCAACYGALPDGKLPVIGFPAGLIAAQSVGERGTQLSMQSFHTGKSAESAVNIHYVRSVLGIGTKLPEPKFGFCDDAEAAKFVDVFSKSDAYKDLQPRHFEILWKVLSWSKDKGLLSAIAAHDAITRMAYRDQVREIALATATAQQCPRQSPFARVLLGGFGASTT